MAYREEENPIETLATRYAGQMGGEYIEELKKTDMATWSEKEWNTFVGCVCTGYVTELIKLRLHAADAMSKVSN